MEDKLIPRFILQESIERWISNSDSPLHLPHIATRATGHDVVELVRAVVVYTVRREVDSLKLTSKVQLQWIQTLHKLSSSPCSVM